ncbi:MAG: phage integrase N-terminal SAM-like domain-containing protein [Blastocatellia bacterium]
MVRSLSSSSLFIIRAEEAYLRWIKNFTPTHGMPHLAHLGGAHITESLSHLAADKSVAVSTWN